MNEFDTKLKSMAEQEESLLTESATQRIAFTLEGLPDNRLNTKRRPRVNAWTVAAAAVMVLFFMLPNISPSIAYAMQSLPIIGKVVQVVTIRDFEYADSHHSAKVAIPRVKVDGKDGASIMHSADLINGDVESLTNALLERFKQETEELGEAYTSMDISYNVVINTDSWFTLKLTVFEGAGSSNTYYKYYHIDKVTGSMVVLKDLFKDNSGYAKAISQNIKDQMKQRMDADDSKIYWLESEFPEWDFTSIKENQNFYFAADGNIVIAFDKYEVGPGSMGCPEFEIPKDIYKEYLKNK